MMTVDADIFLKKRKSGDRQRWGSACAWVSRSLTAWRSSV